jgi:hypothetical protein
MIGCRNVVPRYLLYDGDSLGYDFRDFEAVCEFSRVHPGDTLFVYTRSSNIELFTNTLTRPQVRYLGYSKHDSPRSPPSSLAEQLGIEADATLAFEELHSLVSNRAKSSSGHLIPNPAGYLELPRTLVERYQERLEAMARELGTPRTVFAVVSGLKPTSDVGEDAEQRLEEGRRQTYPLERIAEVANLLQRSLGNRGVALVPLCVQYGDRTEIAAALAEIQAGQRLEHPLRLIEDIDWNDQPLQQAAFYAALRRYGAEHRSPVVTFGNASTYLHLILAAVGGFGAMAVALHGYPLQHPRDGRAYWEELASRSRNLRTFRQSTPGDWDEVTRAMCEHLEARISASSQ